jgi:phage tail sheath protein FI
MSVPRSYPGVYINEVPSESRRISGVATAITAFIGSALRGAEDDPVLMQSFADYTRTFGKLSHSHPMGFSVNQFFQNGGTDALIVRVTEGGLPASVSAGTLNLRAASSGNWGEQISVNISHPDPLVNPQAAANEAFNLVIKDGATGVIESFSNLSTLADNADYATPILEQRSTLVRVDGALPATRPAPISEVSFNANGADGSTITDAEISHPDLASEQGGIWALEKADLFNLLCIPPFTLDHTGDIGAQTRSAAAAYCTSKRAIYIADPLYSWEEAADVTDPASGLGSANWGLARNANSALYFPRVIQPDPLQQGQLAEFPPCGVIAGIISRTDAARGVWKAPAGREATLMGVTALTAQLSSANTSVLNPLAVNCLRSFPRLGHVIWGSRAFVEAQQLASKWKYLPVRRTALFIEESLYRGTQWVVFEPNDDPLWAQIRLQVSAFMQALFRQGALQGSKSSDAYFVICDSQSTTQTDIDNGIVNFVVGFAPLKPAEFVVIKLKQNTATAMA